MGNLTFVPQTMFAKGDGEAHVVGLPLDFDLNKKLASADSVHLATAYGHMSGWDLIKHAVLTCGGAVYLLAGLDHDFTEPRLLSDWLEVANGDTIFAKVFDTNEHLFHPKVLLVNAESTDPDKKPFGIVGSGNLSRGGLIDNVECSVYVEGAERVAQLKSWFERLFSKAAPISSELIRGYEPRYMIARRLEGERRQAGHLRRKRLGQSRTAWIEQREREVINDATEFHVVNTNIRYDHGPGCAHLHMLSAHKACAYEEKWMQKMSNIGKGDVVFLYRSEKWPHPEVPGKPGIVAFGVATGEVRNLPSEATRCVKLEDFRRVIPPISAAEITMMNGSRVTFGQVWQRPNRKLAIKLYREAMSRC